MDIFPQQYFNLLFICNSTAGRLTRKGGGISTHVIFALLCVRVCVCVCVCELDKLGLFYNKSSSNAVHTDEAASTTQDEKIGW